MNQNDQPLNPVAEEAEAIKRIAGTRDGALFHRYLRRVLEGVFDIETDSALRTHNGRRTLARDLMRLMAEGLNVNGNDSSTDAPILTRPGGAVAVTGARGARRRVPGTQPEPGPAGG
jgi:hypothetical protein